jgi:GR25 family glycosyltransferase involved in LPS biosynthesis
VIGGQFETQFDCFVISLKRTPDRLQTFLAHNAKCEIAFQLFEAIDGTQIDTADIEGRIVAKNAMGYTRGIIGNAMSHLALWRRCAEQGKYYVVFEDDAVARSDIKARLLAAIGQLAPWHVVLLGYNTDAALEVSIAPGISFGGGFSVKHPTAKHLSDFANSTNAVALHRLNLAMGLCCYVISPSGAHILAQSCFPMDNRPVHYASTGHKFRAYGLDSIMATIYPKLSAYVSIAPLAMTANDHHTSTVKHNTPQLTVRKDGVAGQAFRRNPTDKL